MSRCERQKDCAFYLGRASVPDSECACEAARFCESAPEECARLAVARHLGPDSVPLDLAPHDSRRALSILRKPPE